MDEAVINGARTDGVNEINNGHGGLDRLVLPASDLRRLASCLESLVDPGNNLSIRDLGAVTRQLSKDVKEVGTHHLPNDCKCEGLVTIVNVLAGNTDEREAELLAQLNGVVAVLDLLHVSTHRPRGLVNSLPVNNTRLNLIEELEKNQAILKIVVEMVDEWVDTEGVHEVSVSLLLTGLLNNNNLLDGLESRIHVEQVGNEGQVELGVTIADILGTDELLSSHLVCVGEHELGALHGILLIKRSSGDAQVLRSNAGEQNSVALRVLNIAREVVNTARMAGLSEVIVEPAEEDLLSRKLEEVLNCFSRLKETVKLRVSLQVNLAEQTNLNDLPDLQRCLAS